MIFLLCCPGAKYKLMSVLRGTSVVVYCMLPLKKTMQAAVVFGIGVGILTRKYFQIILAYFQHFEIVIEFY